MTDTLEPPTPDPVASDAVADSDSVVHADEQPGEQAAAEPASQIVEHPAEPSTEQPDIDLDVIESDLAGVEHALARLAEGTYWVDEVSGEPIPDDVLVSSPTARRAPQH